MCVFDLHSYKVLSRRNIQYKYTQIFVLPSFFNVLKMLKYEPTNTHAGRHLRVGVGKMNTYKMKIVFYIFKKFNTSSRGFVSV